MNLKTTFAPLLLSLFVGLIPITAMGQDELKADEMATVAFDIRVNKLVAMAKKLGLPDEAMEDGPFPSFMAGVTPSDVERVYGQVNIKQGMQAFFMMGPDRLPVEMFMRIRFSTPDVTDKVYQELKRTGATTEVNGVTYLIEREGRDNMMVFQSDMTELEFATKKYMLQKSRKLMSPKLASLWKNVPNSAIRIAVDVDSNQQLVGQMIEEGKRNTIPLAIAFFDLADNLDGMILAADLEAEELVSLELFGKGDDEATELKEGMDGIFGLAKMSAKPMLAELASEQPDMAKLGQQTMDGLTIGRTDNQVRVALKRPEGFETIVKNMVAGAAAAAKKASRLNDYRQLALGILNYESAYRKFPFRTSGIGSPDLSWRVKILPFIEQNQMYEQMDSTAGPDDSGNAQFADKMPKLFGKDGKNANAVWVVSEVDKFAKITDGSSNTIMLLEDAKGQPWLKAKGLTPEEAVKRVTELKDGEDLAAAFYDGSVRLLNNKIPAKTLKALFTPNDGQVIDWSDLGGR